MYDRNEEASLSISGRAASGESFDVSIYFTDQDSRLFPRRIAALAKAAEEVGSGVIAGKPQPDHASEAPSGCICRQCLPLSRTTPDQED